LESFKKTITDSVGTLETVSSSMSNVSTGLKQVSLDAASQADTAKNASEDATSNVATVSTSADELANSILEISQQPKVQFKLRTKRPQWHARLMPACQALPNLLTKSGM
jgi:methyl-accepting chemotaxis protein